MSDDDPWAAWARAWRPMRRPGARADDDDMNAFLFDWDKAADLAALREHGGAQADHIWTMRDGDGLSLVICAGVHYVDRMAYLLTEKAHDGCGPTPQLVLGDPEINVVPDEMTDDELREALEEYEYDAAQPGEAGRIGRRNLDLLREEAARRRAPTS